jgi:branched-chain amino acid transport system permease protein
MGAVIVSGLVSGALYALVASGLSLVWGALGVFNFAHCVLLMAGAYVAWWVSSPEGLGLGLPVAIVVTLAFLVAAGAVLFFLLVKPWAGKPNAELAVIMTTIAGSIFIQNLVLEVFGGRYKTIDQVVNGTIRIAGVMIEAQNLLCIVLAPVLLVGMWLLLTRTRIGLAIRAVAENQDAAQLFGIGVQKIYIVTFAASAVLAGVAEILLGGLFNISPDMGTDPLLRAFIVVVLGGLGSLPGTIVGAYAVGMIEAFASYYIGIYWTPVVLFLVLIAVLAIRPTGLFGRPS